MDRASQVFAGAQTNGLYDYPIQAINQTYTRNGLNQYPQIAGTNGGTLTWDLNGNLTSNGTSPRKELFKRKGFQAGLGRSRLSDNRDHFNLLADCQGSILATANAAGVKRASAPTGERPEAGRHENESGRRSF